jgi:hypothetical protein
MKESDPIDPKTTKTTLSQTETKKKKKSQPTVRHHTDNIAFNQGKQCPLQATPAAPKP